jgi:hypothetical protein
MQLSTDWLSSSTFLSEQVSSEEQPGHIGVTLVLLWADLPHHAIW